MLRLLSLFHIHPSMFPSLGIYHRMWPEGCCKSHGIQKALLGRASTNGVWTWEGEKAKQARGGRACRYGLLRTTSDRGS